MKLLTTAATALALAVTANAALASDACQDGEIVVKFAHVTNTDKHPKGIAASLLEKRVNEEMGASADTRLKRPGCLSAIRSAP